MPILWKYATGALGVLALVLFVLLQGERIHSAKVEKRAAYYRSELVRLTAELDAANVKIAAEIRRRHDEEARRIAAGADALRVSGPGRAAACPPATPGGHQPPGGAGNAPGPEMPPGDRAAVPWQWLVARAESADLNRSEVLAWREWHARLNAEWEAWRKRVPSK